MYMCVSLGMMTCIVTWLLVILIVTLLPVSLDLHIESTEMQGGLILVGAAVCSACKTTNFNQLLLVYCKLIIYYIPVVYSKLVPFAVSVILLCCVSYHLYCTK